MTVDLGSILSSGANGQTTLSGLGSGFNSTELINGLVEARRIPITRLNDSITLNTSQVSAYGELRTSIDNFRTASSFLRNPPGFDQAGNNLFEFRSASTTNSGTTPASDYLNVTAEPGAARGSYDVTVNSIAQSQQLRFGPFTSVDGSVTETAGGTTAGLFSAGTFDIVTGAPTPTANLIQQIDASDASSVNLIGGAVERINDPVGTNNFIQETNAAFRGTIGDINGVDALELDGINDFYASLNDPDINLGTYAEKSIFITFETGADVNTRQYIYEQGGGTNGFSIFIEGGNLYTGAWKNNGNDFDIFNATPITPGTVYNGGFVFDAPNDSMKSYLNGVEYAESTGIITQAAHSGDISIGRSGNSRDETGTDPGNSFFGGKIGEILTYNDALSEDDVSNLYTAQAAKFGVIPPAGDVLASIELEDGDSLNEIVAKINAQTGQSGITATIIQVADNDFRLSLTSENSGIENAFTFDDPNGVVGEVTRETVRSAKDANITVDGLNISRSDNNIDDVIDGLNFNIINATESGDVITVNVGEDIDSVEAGIINFIDAFNEIRVFQARQTERAEGGEFTEDAVLRNDSTLRTIINQFDNSVIGQVLGVDDIDFSRLSDIGITFTDFAGDEENDIPATSNILTYDPTELRNALTGNFEEVRQIFEFSFDADSADIGILSRGNNIELTDFSLDIDTSRTGDEVRVLDSLGAFLFNAEISEDNPGVFTISGPDGSTLDGLELLYTGAGVDTINVGLSSGFADLTYNIAENFLDENDGLIDIAVESITDSNTRLDEEIERIESSIERFRQQLLNQFSALDAAVAQVNTLLDFLEVNSQSIFSD